MLKEKNCGPQILSSSHHSRMRLKQGGFLTEESERQIPAGKYLGMPCSKNKTSKKISQKKYSGINDEQQKNK